MLVKQQCTFLERLSSLAVSEAEQQLLINAAKIILASVNPSATGIQKNNQRDPKKINV